jgi:hypothetical protein
MARANPNTFCTKWLAQSDAMTDKEHAAEDAKIAAKKAADRAETESERKARQRNLDTAILVGPRGNRPFSIFADSRNDPR